MNTPAKGVLTFIDSDGGEPEPGDILTARPNGIRDPDGFDLHSGKYQWLRNGQPIVGATERTYVITYDDQGADLSLRYRFTDHAGNEEVIESKPRRVPRFIRKWVHATYELGLGREPAEAGLNFWCDILDHQIYGLRNLPMDAMARVIRFMTESKDYKDEPYVKEFLDAYR